MHSKRPLVSVVSPVYNGQTYLRECIESVLAQTYSNFEYVIVNNRSSDSTLEIAKDYAARDPRVRVVTNERFISAYDNFNEAMNQASPRSEYVKVLHADDMMFPTCLERMVEAAVANPSVGMVGSYRIQGPECGNDGLPYPSPLLGGRDIVRRTLLGGPYVFGSPSSVLIRADLVRARDEFFDPALRILVDVEAFCYVLAESDFAFLHEVLTYTRWHDDSISRAHEDVGAWYPDMLVILARWRSVFLSEEEGKKRYDDVLGEYYRYLGRSVMHFRGPEFWAHHRDWLTEIGHPASRAFVGLRTVTEVFRRLGRPFGSVWESASEAWSVRHAEARLQSKSLVADARTSEKSDGVEAASA